MTVSKEAPVRFPEFSSDNYQTYQVSDFLSRHVDPVQLKDGEEYTEIGIRSWGKGIFSKKPTTKAEIGDKRVFWLEADLFIVNIVFAWEQAVAVSTASEVGKIASHRFPMFRVNNRNAVLKYVQYKFLTGRGKQLLELASPGGAGRNKTLGQKEFEKLKVVLPSTKEQQKIADFLVSIDTKIDQLTYKHQLLKIYRQGVMQKVFNQEIRFEDENGDAFPDWKFKALSEIAIPVKRKATAAVENVMTISAGRGFLQQKDRFSQIIAGTSLDKYTHLKRGEFAYNRGNSKSFKYGCIYPLQEAEALVPFVYRSFKLTHGIPDFYAQLFEYKYLDRQLRRLISSSARMNGLLNIGEKDFYQVTLPIPDEVEQRKIAKFLKSIDTKIEVVAEQIYKTKQFKKGLLQQMFV